MSIYTRGVRGTAPTREESRPIGSKRPLDEFKEFSEQHIKEKKEAAALKESAEYQRKQQEAANLEESRKQAAEMQQDAEKQAKEQREKELEMSQAANDAGRPDTTYMYNSHYDMVKEFAEYLSNPDTIKQYASSPKGEMEFNGLIDQLMSMTSDFEAYYKETYGSPEDEDERYTFMGSENRFKHGVSNIGDLNVNTSHEEMMARLMKLDSHLHKEMKIVNGKAVFVGEDGGTFNPQDSFDMEVFYPEVEERAPVSGDQYLNSTFDPNYFTSIESVERHVRSALNNDKGLLRDTIRGYIEKRQDEDPGFNETIESIISHDPERLEAIKQTFIDDAVRAYEIKTLKPEDVEINIDEEEEEAPQVSEQAETTEAAVQEDNSAIEESTAQLEQALGRTPTEEEIQMLFEPEMQAMLRAIGIDMDFSPDEQAPDAQFQSAETEPTPADLQDFAQDMGLNLRDVSMDMFEPDTPLGDAFRQYNIERSRIRSLVDEQRALNAERNQTMVDDFGDKFSGDLQEALANYGQTPEVQTQPQGDPYYDYGDEKINKMINVPAAYTTEGSTSTRGFEGDNVKLKTSPDPSQAPSDLIGMSFNADAGEFVVTLSGDRQVKLSIDREGNMQLDPTDLSGFLDDVGNRIPIGLIVIQEFNKVYGDGAFGAIAGRLQNEALRSAGLLVE
tara:strand:- start:810 stop:2828 length:2019 start_codon:yes stop_codon:yes gene_type:complete